MEKGPSLPFAVNRNDARPLVDQVADGLRMAIVGGSYCPGDEIPSSRELVPLLGVSRIVTSAAITRLAKEGLVLTRHGLRPVVRDRGAKQWRGHVVFVTPEGDENYYETVLASALRNRLSEAGYLFTQVCIPYTSPDDYDFARLDVALAQSIDLIVTMSVPQLVARVARQKVPYAICGGSLKKMPSSAVGVTHTDFNLAMGDFAAACKAAGVKEVVGFYYNSSMGDVAALRQAGVRVRKVMVKADESQGALIGAKQAGLEIFSRLIAEGRLPRGTVCFINDDYVASGALMALACAGLKAPEDIRLVTFANRRLGPVYPRELTRMEFDARHAGEVLAAAVLEYLRTGVYPTSSVVGPKWVAGETLGAAGAAPSASG